MILPIQIISAPSILGLRPDGVELLADRLLSEGLAEKLQTTLPVIHVPTLNDQYDTERDKDTQCLNPSLLHDFSLLLMDQIHKQIDHTFPLVLGGDCSILLGIMPALKEQGKYGLIFIDAHADFYQPSRSTTGEVADMDLAIVTGHGPEILTNINDLKPYVEEKHVIHIAQRDAEETKKYGSQDIRETSIHCYDLAYIRSQGLDKTINAVTTSMTDLTPARYWIHFDTDVIHDNENPAVDYRLPGGLYFAEAEQLLKDLVATGRIAGISVTVYNPRLDISGKIAKDINECLKRAFSL